MFLLCLVNQTQSTDEALTKRDDQHELNQSKAITPVPPTTTTTTTSAAKQSKSLIQFEQFTRLPDGLCKFVGDLIGTPLDEIDQYYKDQQVRFISVFSLRTF